MAFVDMAAELQGAVPRLPYLHGVQLINKSWSRVRDWRLWSFHVIPDAQVFVPAVINGGSITTTFGSTTIVTDTAATAAINALGPGPNPPIGSPVLGIGRQIKVGNATISALLGATGQNYSIVAWDSTGKLIIDKPYGEPSATGAQYQILKCYYAPPNYPFTNIPSSPDQGFVKYLTIANRKTGYAIRGKNLYYTQAKLNAVDPQRGGQGDAYILASYGRNSLGQPVHEWYPNPVSQATYTATYITRWPDLSPTQDLPKMPYELPDCVMYMAKSLAGDWALGNVGTYPELQRTNWVAYITKQEKEFREALIQCIKMDDEIAPWLPDVQRASYDFPMGGQFLQSHDLSSVIGGGGL